MEDQREPEGHPVVVMAVGGFIGGLVAGGNNAGFWGFVVLALVFTYGALAVTGHIDKRFRDQAIGTILGLSTTIPLPAGFVGMIVGKALWGGH